MPSLPTSGSVLGIDVGWSARTRSNAICRLDWDQSAIVWTIKRSRGADDDRRAAIIECAGDAAILAVAIDGPLSKGFPVTGRYRAAERMLTRQLARHIGKPGQSSSPVGKTLNYHANLCAQLALDHCRLASWQHEIAIHEQAVVEAFPTTYLGLLLNEPQRLADVRGSRSDVYFAELAANGTLERLLNHLLPGRQIGASLASVTNHDDRAGLICAFTALGVASRKFTAVGDEDGWIVLPPLAFVSDWARRLIELNAGSDQSGRWISGVPLQAP